MEGGRQRERERERESEEREREDGRRDREQAGGGEVKGESGRSEDGPAWPHPVATAAHM